MSETPYEITPSEGINPAAIPAENLARMLGLSAEVVQRHIEEGAPLNRDGTMNLIHYAAWLNNPADHANEDADVGLSIH